MAEEDVTADQTPEPLFKVKSILLVCDRQDLVGRIAAEEINMFVRSLPLVSAKVGIDIRHVDDPDAFTRNEAQFWIEVV